MKQQRIQQFTLQQAQNGTSNCIELNVTSNPPNPMLGPLVLAIDKLKPKEILDVQPFEIEHVQEETFEPETCNDNVINLSLHRKRKKREKFRETLQLGAPTPHSYLCTHHFRNDKPSVWLCFKLEGDNSAEKTECIQTCTDMIPKVVQRSQMRIVKNGFNRVTNMQFAKKSSKVNYLLSTVSESLNLTVKMDPNFKEDIRRELNMLTNLENNDLLADSALGNKLIYGGQTMFGTFIEKLNLAIKEDTAPDSRRHNQNLYCSK